MATKKATKSKSTTKTTKAKAKVTRPNGQEVTFTSAIPKVTRQGSGNRQSKYDELLNDLVERHENDQSATARVEFDTVGKATSRYQSIKSAIEKRDEDSHLFVVAQRDESDEDAERRAVYVQYDPTLPEPSEDDTEASEDDEDAEF